MPPVRLNRPPEADSPPGYLLMPPRSGLLRSTAVVGGFTLISRILGFLRDVLFARLFGADSGTDAFFVAFKIPNFLRRLFAEGAFANAFVPVFAEYRAQRPHSAARDLVAHVAGTLGGITLALSLLGIAAAPLLILVFAPGFWAEPDQRALAADLLRLTFPYLFFIALVALAGAVLNSVRHFAVPAFTPVLLNISLISAALLVAPGFDRPVVALAWGVLLAGLVQLLFQLPFLARAGLLVRPRWGWRHPGVERVIALMIPALLGTAVVQINLLIDTIIASFLVAGSVSWLYYSDRLMEFPLGLFGVALGTVILPHLSQQQAQANQQRFAETLDWALRLTLLIAVPAALGLILLGGPILTTLFEFQAFTGDDTRMARLSLAAYAFGLPAFVAIRVLGPGFYARQDTRTPVRIAIRAMVVNLVLNAAFVIPWALSDQPGAHAGLALATALSAWTNAGLLYVRLRQDGVATPQPGWMPLALRSGLALVALAGIILWFAPPLSVWQAASAGTRALNLTALIAAAAGVYGLALLVTGVRPNQLRAPT